MSRYETLLEGIRHNVRPEMSAEDIERLAQPLIDLNEKESATSKAYKICGCGTEYTETQWACLVPVPGRPWKWDDYTLEEWRECSDCGAAMVVLERNGKQRPANTIAWKAYATASHCCGSCMALIKAGTQYVERLEKRNGMRVLGRWAFCSTECEAW